MNHSSLPDLPYELEREIFEWAARAYPKCAPSLALVASYVQEWVEATIYEVIVLGACCPKLELFFRTLSSRPTTFFAKNIRVLHLAAGVSHTQARKLLTVCTNLSSLTCEANPLGSGEEFCTSLEAMFPNLRRLSINVASLLSPTPLTMTGTNFIHPFLARLTHLELVNPPTWFDWISLLDGSLPNLTHLAFGNLTAAHSPKMIDFSVAALASDVPRFQMLIAISQNEVFLNALERAGLIGPESGRDMRFVCLPCYYYPFGSSEYWEGVARREVQFWRTPEVV
ncbi:hypothetical protein FB45DRAFT_1051239 [Roridomyces roridus]|uniref:Uncharacterized protein n=1 Tax=Roridomyces roridus TaxID=1738132 RepID=A0AAD7CDQ3_9AGAR|nr:hypothetical protein FB45DRAFT_1051239 [Roridomyces roridus]